MSEAQGCPVTRDLFCSQSISRHFSYLVRQSALACSFISAYRLEDLKMTFERLQRNFCHKSLPILGPGQGCVDGLIPVGRRAVSLWNGQAIQDGCGIRAPRGMEVWILVYTGGVSRVRVVVV